MIPKVQSPETVNDYRPITLLNCCLKMITKILANRLQKLILKIIHRNQYGFLRGRSIQDCLAWAFEFIHQCQASGKECVILKLDFSKAYDTIEHGPMMEIMRWGLLMFGLNGLTCCFLLPNHLYCSMGRLGGNSSAEGGFVKVTRCRH